MLWGFFSVSGSGIFVKGEGIKKKGRCVDTLKENLKPY